MIINGDMVQLAFYLISPSVEEILKADETTWGPKYVEGVLSAPGLKEDFLFRFGEVPLTWDPKWGELPKKSFLDIAKGKLQLAKREKENTSVTVLNKPWLVADGEYLYAGAAFRDGITAAASGAKGWVDEAISSLFIDTVIMLAHLDADRRVANNQKQI